jgi:hypothetical protein
MPSGPDLVQFAGLAFVFFAIVGGGAAFGVAKTGKITSRWRQVLLGIFGVMLLIMPYSRTAGVSRLVGWALRQGPHGSIDYPMENSRVPRVFECHGSATGIPESEHLWLVEEDSAHNMWPKDSLSTYGLVLDSRGKWNNHFEEYGTPGIFSISLVMANSAASDLIRKWLETGKKNGQYSILKGIPGATPITSVTGLTLQ